ncbi:unnamed protein product (macronuclear) [Paramecium tetraurelia]|uniref:Protein kinase domain-containing protein n=1 Tax=Paramecium tetraurelia TaxID=5888 RepID=A0E692_PARTE|nr:uncharacterized protein GSPATT00003674001 [Paramecium tetraurelia]CAK90809.1 unnamed protein product [Paramecium tetraurelia]|eukprot:XP_001458206.1 hypothetical protein (macronuclear) [Paramecium tetraurelia strain d4-2]
MLSLIKMKEFSISFRNKCQGRKFDNDAAVQGYYIKIRFYAAQVVLFLEYLHSNRILYRSLNSQHLMIGSDDYLRQIVFILQYYTKEKEQLHLQGIQSILLQKFQIIQDTHSPLIGGHWELRPFERGEDDLFDLLRKIQYGQYKMHNYFSKQIINSLSKNLIYNLLQVKPWDRVGNLRGGINDIQNHMVQEY